MPKISIETVGPVEQIVLDMANDFTFDDIVNAIAFLAQCIDVSNTVQICEDCNEPWSHSHTCNDSAAFSRYHNSRRRML